MNFKILPTISFIITGLLFPALTLAQSCSLGTTGITINSSCSISGAAGIDDGAATNRATFRVNTGSAVTINAGATLAVGVLDLTGGGTIVYPANFRIEVGKPVYVVDNDGDGHPASLSTIMIGSTGVGSTWVRVANVNATVDTNDADYCPPSTPCKNNCQRCVSGATTNVTAGKACSNGSEVAVTTSIHCGTTATTITDSTSANGCSGTRTNTTYYRACNGTGTCYADNTSAASVGTTATLYAANGRIFTNSSGTTAVPNATYKCNTVDATSANGCSGTRYYRACNGSGSCRSDNTGAGSATLYAANGRVFTNATGTTAVPNATYKCNTVNGCTSGYCFGTIYYSACNGSGSCRNDSTGAGVGSTFLANNLTYYNSTSCGTTAVGACSGGNNCTTFRRDADGDGVGVGTTTTTRCGSTPPSGYVANTGSTDCCDSLNTVYPGNTNYYTTAHAACTGVASNWDYNCDGAITYVFGTGNTPVPYVLRDGCSGMHHYNYRLDGCSSGYIGYDARAITSTDCGTDKWTCLTGRYYADAKTEARKDSCTNACDNSPSAWASAMGWFSCSSATEKWTIKCR